MGAFVSVGSDSFDLPPLRVVVDEHILRETSSQAVAWYFRRVEAADSGAPCLQFLALRLSLDHAPLLSGCVFLASREAVSAFGDDARKFSREVLLFAVNEPLTPAVVPPDWREAVSGDDGLSGRAVDLLSVGVGLMDRGFFTEALAREERSTESAAALTRHGVTVVTTANADAARLAASTSWIRHRASRRPVTLEAIQKLTAGLVH